ncbi:MAG: cytochrome-c oxidase, cbb3-type subunit III [Magnetococcales bacterium]|nr:cytochrome-c oxidase, cbb3-type subunit III [Magnetococcales bacterium]
MQDHKNKIDPNSEVETTGHQWDDDEGYPLKEFNNPLPKWWLYTFYATIIWAIVYWVLYPAWPLPNGNTEGMLGWTQKKQLAEEIRVAKEAQKPFDNKLASLSLEEINKDNSLLQYAISGGKAIFGDNCAPCHGSGGVGSKAHGFPTLVDDDWIFGGTLADINETVQNGRTGAMPAHLESADGAFTQAQVNDLAEYVLSISNQSHDAVKAGRGDTLFHGEASCNACHGDNGRGSLKDTFDGERLDKATGAPNLTDAVWLYGGSRETITQTIARGRTGKMPAWGEGFEGFGRQLDPLSIKQVVLYVHSLGGGQ